MNYNKDYSPYSIKYFDKRVPEEDSPINVSDDIQQRYEELDIIFEDFFDDNSLHLAKVTIYTKN